MRNKHLKKMLIQNYITLREVNNFCFNFTPINLSESEKECLTLVQNFSQELLQSYKKIMFKLNLMDLSLAILDKEFLLSDKECDNFSFAKIKDCYFTLKNIEENLEKSVEKMKLNVFELNYLNINNFAKFTSQNFLFS